MIWVDTFLDAIDASFTDDGCQYGIGEATVLGCRTFVAASLNCLSIVNSHIFFSMLAQYRNQVVLVGSSFSDSFGILS